jgi:hypothetical protein
MMKLRRGGDVPAPPRPWLNGPLRDEEEERRAFSSVVVMRDAIFACFACGGWRIGREKEVAS